MGVKSCNYVAKGETAEEAAQTMMEHAKKAHSEKVKEMLGSMSPEEMIDAMKERVKED